MRIVEQSQQRLVLNSSFLFFTNTNYIFDKAGGELRIQRKSLFGGAQPDETHSLSDFQGATVEEMQRSRRERREDGPQGACFRVVLTKRDGNTLPLTTSYTSGKKDKEKAAQAISELLT